MPISRNDFSASSEIFLPSKFNYNDNKPENACKKKFDQMLGRGFEAREVGIIDILDEFGIHSEIFNALSNPLLKQILLKIHKGLNLLSDAIMKYGANSSQAQNLIPEIKENIQSVIKQLTALQNECEGSLGNRRQEALDKLIEWLVGKGKKLDETAKLLKVSTKQSATRSQIDTFSNNLFEFSKFSVNLPDGVIRRTNSFVNRLTNPPAQKPTKARFETEMRKDQAQEIERRKNKANENPVGKFATEAMIFILRNPQYLLK